MNIFERFKKEKKIPFSPQDYLSNLPLGSSDVVRGLIGAISKKHGEPGGVLLLGGTHIMGVGESAKPPSLRSNRIETVDLKITVIDRRLIQNMAGLIEDWSKTTGTKMSAEKNEPEDYLLRIDSGGNNTPIRITITEENAVSKKDNKEPVIHLL